MKFGIFFEISIPKPWGPETEKQAYDNCFEQVRLADELGFDQVWAVEHHFLEEYSHCSAPEVFLTACAMQTKQIRLGHGIVVCVPAFNHPVRVAERAAVLDVLSGGRLELGTGRSATWTELGGFGVDPDVTKKTWDEYVRAIPKMWTEDVFSWDGFSFSMPERTVLPRPVQEPHPPMWVAVTTPGTEIDAAERGLGALGLAFTGFAEQEQRVADYRRRIKSCDPVGLFVNEQFSTVNFLYCHEDLQRGVQTGLRIQQTFAYQTAQFIGAREAVPTRGYPSGALLPQVREQGSAPGDSRVPEGLAVGDPDRITDVLKQWESVGIDRVNFLLDCLGVVSQREILDSLRLFAREVMPAFASPTGTSKNNESTGVR